MKISHFYTGRQSSLNFMLVAIQLLNDHKIPRTVELGYNDIEVT